MTMGSEPERRKGEYATEREPPWGRSLRHKRSRGWPEPERRKGDTPPGGNPVGALSERPSTTVDERSESAPTGFDVPAVSPAAVVYR